MSPADPGQRRARFYGALTLLLSGVVAVVGQLGSRPSPDAAWNLYVARELLGGSRLGLDVVENTPPMIFLLKVPTVALAAFLGLRAWTAWVVMVGALAGLAIVLALRLSRRWRFTGAGQLAVAGGLSLALLAIPSADFGQRDHVMVILVVPYIFLATLRVNGTAVSPLLAVLIGVLTGVGIGIKPHFALLPLALMALLAHRKDFRGVVAPEQLAIGVVGISYVASVALFAPDYFRYVAMYGRLYQHFQTDFFLVGGRGLSLPPWIGAALEIQAVPGYAALGLSLAVRGQLSDDERPVAGVLALATGALLLAAIVQGKGWRYHFLPSMVLAVLLTALLLSRAARQAHRPLVRLYVGLGGGVLAAVVGSVVPATLLRTINPTDPRLDADPNLPMLLPLVRSVGAQGRVAVLSTTISSGFPLVLEGGARWAFRGPNLWPLVAFYPDDSRGASLVRAPRFADRSSLEQRFDLEVVDDLIQATPDLLLVLRPDSTSRGWGGARRFDYLTYFSEVPRFGELVISRYQPGGTVGLYDVYWRRPSQARMQLSGAPKLRLIPRQSLGDWEERLAVVAFLAGCAEAWRAARRRRPLPA